VLDAEDIEKIAGTYHAWRNVGGSYEDVPGFCKAATKAEIAAHDFVLTPGRYVGAEEVEGDGEPFEEKMERLVTALREQQAEGRRLDALIDASVQRLGW
jgi:type I restriction enzyme M protein